VTCALLGDIASADGVEVTICPWSPSNIHKSIPNTSAGHLVDIVTERDGCVVTKMSGLLPTKAGERVEMRVILPDAKLWVPGTRAAQTNLYIATITLSSSTLISANGDLLDSRSARFGIYNIETIGPRIKFNGEVRCLLATIIFCWEVLSGFTMLLGWNPAIWA
jgi:hypothetical protein